MLLKTVAEVEEIHKEMCWIKCINIGCTQVEAFKLQCILQNNSVGSTIYAMHNEFINMTGVG